MSMVRVRDVSVVEARVLRVVFSDGLVRELDLAGCRSGLFSALDDDAVFNSVTIDPLAGTVSFPGGIDLDPDVLHGDADAAARGPVLLRQYRLEHSG